MMTDRLPLSEPGACWWYEATYTTGGACGGYLTDDMAAIAEWPDATRIVRYRSRHDDAAEWVTVFDASAPDAAGLVASAEASIEGWSS